MAETLQSTMANTPIICRSTCLFDSWHFPIGMSINVAKCSSINALPTKYQGVRFEEVIGIQVKLLLIKTCFI